MCHYHHLTLVEREKNMFFHAQDNSVSAIAKSLGVTRRPFPENYGEIPKMDFINLPLPNIRSQILAFRCLLWVTLEKRVSFR